MTKVHYTIFVAMDVIFHNKHLDRLETDAGFESGYSADVVRAYRKRMQLIRAVVDEREFYSLKSLNFERLKGKRQHQYSMRLNDQWRLILEFEGKGRNKMVVVVDIEDYH